MPSRFFHRREPGSPRLENPFRPRRFRVRRFNRRKKDIKLIFLLPNVLTSFNVVAGISSILFAVNGNYEVAAILILVAAFFDMIDGKVARFVGSASPFGVQLDSLADMISFGVAPPMLIHSVLYDDIGRLGLSMVIVYSLCTALRLARYNVQANQNANKKRDSFVGLPCPVPACFVASGVLVGLELQSLTPDILGVSLAASNPFIRTFLHILMVALACLMVSTIPYPDLSARLVEKKQVYQHNVIMVLVLGVILLITKISIFVFSGTFILLGPLQMLQEPAKIPAEREEAHESPPPEVSNPGPDPDPGESEKAVTN